MESKDTKGGMSVKIDTNTILTSIVLAVLLYAGQLLVKLESSTELLQYKVEQLEKRDSDIYTNTQAKKDFESILARIEKLENQQAKRVR